MDIQVLKVEPGRAPEMVTMSNTLEAFQAAVDIVTISGARPEMG